jgi:hypothetical protein
VSKVYKRLGGQATATKAKARRRGSFIEANGSFWISKNKQLPLFIEQKSLDHPTTNGWSIEKIVKV